MNQRRNPEECAYTNSREGCQPGALTRTLFSPSPSPPARTALSGPCQQQDSDRRPLIHSKHGSDMERPCIHLILLQFQRHTPAAHPVRQPLPTPAARPPETLAYQLLSSEIRTAKVRANRRKHKLCRRATPHQRQKAPSNHPVWLHLVWSLLSRTSGHVL